MTMCFLIIRRKKWHSGILELETLVGEIQQIRRNLEIRLSQVDQGSIQENQFSEELHSGRMGGVLG